MKHRQFDYSIRVSSKVKYTKLRVNPFGRLEVVIPPHLPKKSVPELLNLHTDWIERQLCKHPQPGESVLPDEIYLRFDESRWQVNYDTDVLDSSLKQIVIEGCHFKHKIWQLRNWIRQQAWAQLPPLLEALSRQTGLSYKKINIRSQKTRWGSCSGTGTISVNDQLLFLPRDTATYLMIHELCHTQQMNHSVKFWRLVEHHCPSFRDHESQLNQARGKIPDWFLRDLYG